ncbi:MAG: ABC transporter permease [Acidobacteriota bacterium]
MGFVLKLTRREIRSSWRRLLFFFICIAIGVSSVVALRSMISNLGQAVGGDARALLTADIEISSTNEFSPPELEKIDTAVAASGLVEARNETISAAAMAKAVGEGNESLKLSEIKGIDPPFPLVGTFETGDGEPFDFKLIAGNGAVVSPLLLDDLQIKVGDKISIGQGVFTVNAVFSKEPGGTGGFRLGPRIFIERKAFDSAGITAGSGRIRRSILLRTSDNPSDLTARLKESLKGTTVRVQSYRESQENINEQFSRAENFLALTGLLILVLGGVGVWNVARVFVDQKRKSVAILKCLGAKGGEIITGYLLQIVILGFFGSAFGVLLAQVFLWLAKAGFSDALPKDLSYTVGISPAGQGLLLGVAISVVFSSLPLMQVRNIKPRLLLNEGVGDGSRRLDWQKTIIGGLSLGALLGLAVWQAGSVAVGIVFLAGIGIASGLLYLASGILTGAVKNLKKFGSFAVTQAINSLYRPGNQTKVVLLAVGLGTFVMLSVQLTQKGLLREFDFSKNEQLPSMFIVDAQKSQIENIKARILERTGELPETVPTVRAKIAAVNGEPLNFDNRETRQQQGQIGREFAVTYRDRLEKNEKVIAGSWFGSSDVPEVSVEQGMATRLNLKIGDSISFDISGRSVTARVASVRKIDFKRSRTFFIFVFAPGTIDLAPQSYAANVMIRLPEADRQRLQRGLIDEFPNLQIFDVADIVATITRLVDNIVLAVSFVGGFVILSGILILIGSIALTKSQRIYEAAILKTLGASKNTLAAIMTVEYGILGLLAGVIGGCAATMLSFAASRWVLQTEWTFEPSTVIVGSLLTAVLVTCVGLGASFNVLFKKPLSTLRAGE